MSSENNNHTDTRNKNEPTIADVFALLVKVPVKDDLMDMKQELIASNEENKRKIEVVEQQVDALAATSETNTDRIRELEDTVQVLQQEKLVNNVCISGVPPNENLNAIDAVHKIANTLNVDIAGDSFTAYPTANKKLIIVKFQHHSTKQTLINKIRVKKSLMVEEVFDDLQSNSQIYINDQLTRYFSEMFVLARQACKDGKLATASSIGGKIRVRKQQNSLPIVITNKVQLINIMEMEVDSGMLHNQIEDGNGETSHHSRSRGKEQTEKTKRSAKRQNRSSSAKRSDSTNKSSASNSITSSRVKQPAGKKARTKGPVET